MGRLIRPAPHTPLGVGVKTARPWCTAAKLSPWPCDRETEASRMHILLVGGCAVAMVLPEAADACQWNSTSRGANPPTPDSDPMSVSLIQSSPSRQGKMINESWVLGTDTHVVRTVPPGMTCFDGETGIAGARMDPGEDIVTKRSPG